MTDHRRNDNSSPTGKHMLSRARSLRRGATHEERLLWSHLSQFRKVGIPFRRQAPFDRYVLDFVCHQRRLVVEIDGIGHDQPRQRQRDAVRDARLARDGYLVLRFGTSDIRNNIQGVLDSIFEIANRRRPQQTEKPEE